MSKPRIEPGSLILRANALPLILIFYHCLNYLNNTKSSTSQSYPFGKLGPQYSMKIFFLNFCRKFYALLICIWNCWIFIFLKSVQPTELKIVKNRTKFHRILRFQPCKQIRVRYAGFGVIRVAQWQNTGALCHWHCFNFRLGDFFIQLVVDLWNK